VTFESWPAHEHSIKGNINQKPLNFQTKASRRSNQINFRLNKQHREKLLLLKGSEKATSRRERSIILNIRISTVLFIIIALSERQYGNQKTQPGLK